MSHIIKDCVFGVLCTSNLVSNDESAGLSLGTASMSSQMVGQTARENKQTSAVLTSNQQSIDRINRQVNEYDYFVVLALTLVNTISPFVDPIVNDCISRHAGVWFHRKQQQERPFHITSSPTAQLSHQIELPGRTTEHSVHTAPCHVLRKCHRSSSRRPGHPPISTITRNQRCVSIGVGEP